MLINIKGLNVAILLYQVIILFYAI